MSEAEGIENPGLSLLRQKMQPGNGLIQTR